MTVLRSPIRSVIRSPQYAPNVGKWGGAFDTLDLFADGTAGIYHDFSQTDRLFQDTAFTAVSADTNPAGVAFEESRWGGQTLSQVVSPQTELVTNGTFTTDTSGWSTVLSSLAVVSGRMQVTATSTGGRGVQSFAVVVGKAYRVLFDQENGTQIAGFRAGTTAGGSEYFAVSSTGSYSRAFVATGTTLHLSAIPSGVGTAFYDNISVKEIPGNHATQSTSSARPWYYTPGLLRSDASDDNLLSTFVLGSSGNALVAKVKVPASLAATQVVMGTSGSSTARLFMGFNTSGHMVGGVGSDSTTTVVHAVDYRGLTGTMALVETGSAWTLYWDGVAVATAAQSGTPTTTVPVRLFALNNNGTAGSFAAIDAFHMLGIRKPLTAADIRNLTGAWA